MTQLNKFLYYLIMYIDLYYINYIIQFYILIFDGFNEIYLFNVY